MRRIGIILILLIQGVVLTAQRVAMRLIDPAATAETRSLYQFLSGISGKSILFGHQHATEYGHGWTAVEGRSDVKLVTGSHPAVVGVDFSGLSGVPDSIVAKNKAWLHKLIVDTYDRGGVITVAWHMNNPASPTSFYWNDSSAIAAVPLMLPAGRNHEDYRKSLRTVASLANSVTGRDGSLAPMIFRPFHELDGGWFWWGRPHCSAADMQSLWRFTITYLRDSLGVHNLIYAFSPDCTFTSQTEYLERYPGDDYVDMLGIDDYADFGRYGKYNLDSGLLRLHIVSGYAQKHGKLAAFTETGLESIPNANWWTEVLLRTLKAKNLRFCYVLVWRNDSQSATHFYAPFPGQLSVPDFLRFYDDPFTLFEVDLKNVYGRQP